MKTKEYQVPENTVTAIIYDMPPIDSDELWKQGVNMDDWDYFALCDDLSQFTESQSEHNGRMYWNPQCYTLERILTGCCENTWYKVEIFGKTQMLGVAYHS